MKKLSSLLIALTMILTTGWASSSGGEMDIFAPASETTYYDALNINYVLSTNLFEAGSILLTWSPTNGDPDIVWTMQDQAFPDPFSYDRGEDPASYTEVQSATALTIPAGTYDVTLSYVFDSEGNPSDGLIFDVTNTNIIVSDLIPGCTDDAACNYNPLAESDDGSCAFNGNSNFYGSWVIYMADCEDPTTPAEMGDGPYEFAQDGYIYYFGEPYAIWESCGEEWTVTFEEVPVGTGYFDEDSGNMIYSEGFEGEEFCGVFVPYSPFGCTDEDALNYDSEAEQDNGSCLYEDVCENTINDQGNTLDFTVDYDPANWTTLSEGDGSVTHTEDELIIVGSDDDEEAEEALTQVTITAVASGTFTFDWYYSTTDDAPEYDIAYYINGERIDLVELFDEDGLELPPNDQFGSITFEANEGDEIGFGVDATDDCCGNATLTISNFTAPANCDAGCWRPQASNYSPETEFEDDDLCIYLDPCGNETGPLGPGAGFYQEFDFDMWTQINEGTGDFDHDNGYALYIEGSDTEDGFEGLSTALEIEIPFSGEYSFSWVYFTDDDNSGNDPAFYTVNGETITLTALIDEEGEPILNDEQSGTVNIFLEEGDVFTIGVLSINDCCGFAGLVITSFNYPTDCEGGCQDETASNYAPDSDYDNGWCTYEDLCGDLVSGEGDLVYFTGDYAPENWTVLSEGDGSTEITEEFIDIIGSDGGGDGEDVLTEVSIEATESGTYTFNWVYTTFDGPEYDVAYYVLNERTDLTIIEDEFENYVGQPQSGTVTLEVTAGDIIAFGVEATDDCCSPGELLIQYFTHPNDECIAGCTDSEACNYDEEAEGDDGSCDYSCYGCTDPVACNYDSEATLDDESCEFESCAGCTDPFACNFDEEATLDDESCEFESCAGCTDPAACNYDEEATIDDSQCDYESCAGCTDPVACNYDAEATIEDDSCEFDSCAGCTDPEACNYDQDATIEDDSCEFDSCAGCTDPEACNYDEDATIEDDSCEFDSCAGCTDPEACNYDEDATIEDDSCEYESCAGCTDEDALNYDENATIDDGSCFYECDFPALSFEVTDCEMMTFTVNIEVDGMGDCGPYTLTNDQTDNEISIDASGDFTTGGFDPGSEVVFVLSSDSFDDAIEYAAVSCPVNITESSAAELIVYPNPAQYQLTIEGITANSLVRLIDMRGRIVSEFIQSTENERTTLDVQQIETGNYVLQVINNDRVINEKVMIRR